MSPITSTTKPEVIKRKPIAETIGRKEEKAPFTVSRHKKIHLSAMSSRISENNFVNFVIGHTVSSNN